MNKSCSVKILSLIAEPPLLMIAKAPLAGSECTIPSSILIQSREPA